MVDSGDRSTQEMPENRHRPPLTSAGRGDSARSTGQARAEARARPWPGHGTTSRPGAGVPPCGAGLLGLRRLRAPSGRSNKTTRSLRRFQIAAPVGRGGTRGCRSRGQVHARGKVVRTERGERLIKNMGFQSPNSGALSLDIVRPGVSENCCNTFTNYK